VTGEQEIQRVLEHCIQPECLNRISDVLQELWAESGDVSELDRMMFEIALIELAGNVVQHRQIDADFDCYITLRVFGAGLEAVICDSGQPVTVDLAAAALPDDLAEHGRGIPMARAALHDLTYERVAGLNYWRIRRDRTG
jgi:serine/threonine-protein kinase RsbW